jgi:serine/threonine-protein kinase
VSDDIDFDDETTVEPHGGASGDPLAHPLGPDYPAIDTYGRYEILGRLAVGGMAEVFLAREMASHGAARHVAVKRILPQIADDATFVEMFLDEARLAMRLTHPNICHIYDIGELEETYFIAMEWVNGVAFGKLITKGREQGGMPINIAVKIIAHVADALNYAHQARDGVGRPLNIVHRDVSPQNIMVRYDGVVKLLDFGIAKAATQTSQTEAGIVKGKFSYMSPEQCLGKPLDARSDIFAIGACLYEGLTGKPAFRRGSDLDTMRAIVHEPIPSARLVRTDVPPRLDAILRKALAKDPVQRFQTAGELYVALERFLAEEGAFVHAMHIASAIETLIPDASSRGPLGPGSNPSQRALQLPASGSRPSPNRISDQKPQLPEHDPDLDTLDTHLAPDPSFDVDLSDSVEDEEDLPTEQWSGDNVPSVIKRLHEEAIAAKAAQTVEDGGTTNVANPGVAGVPAIYTDNTAALPGKSYPPPDLDPFGQPADFGTAPRGPSTLLRVSVVVLALFAAALVTVAIVWSTTEEPLPTVGETAQGEGESTTEGTSQAPAETDDGPATTTETPEGPAEVPPPTGTVAITTTPSGATIVLDGRRGRSPLTWDDVAPGTHVVRARLDGFEPGEHEVVVVAGGRADVNFTLAARASPEASETQTEEATANV